MKGCSLYEYPYSTVKGTHVARTLLRSQEPSLHYLQGLLLCHLKLRWILINKHKEIGGIDEKGTHITLHTKVR